MSLVSYPKQLLISASENFFQMQNAQLRVFNFPISQMAVKS